MAADPHQFEPKLVRRGAQAFNISLLQGAWTVEHYLNLTDQTNQLIEFTDGMIEVLPMPTDNHQAISRLLFLALLDFVHPEGGTVFYAPLRLQVRPGAFREPDLLLLLNGDDPRRQNAFWLGADIVVEIVDADRPDRDLEQKPRDYAEGGIPEYWSVNPIDQSITVLHLIGKTYVPHGTFRRGQFATSVLLEDFTVDVAEVFDTR